jgi:hypothetical protein
MIFKVTFFCRKQEINLIVTSRLQQLCFRHGKNILRLAIMQAFSLSLPASYESTTLQV